MAGRVACFQVAAEAAQFARPLTQLRDAGLDSLPGGGAEILVDRVRKIISPKKTTTGEWLGIMREAHNVGMSTTATMMYGHVETLEERVEHMRRIRELQDETHGFRAFISWTFQPEGTRLAAKVPRDSMPTSFDYLLTQAVSRIYLDNVDHIQSSWVTQGLKVGQVALDFGADDMGSVMIEENVVSAAGTTHRATADDFVRAIKALGKTAVQRDTLYRDVAAHAGRHVHPGDAADRRRPRPFLRRHRAEAESDRSVRPPPGPLQRE